VVHKEIRCEEMNRFPTRTVSSGRLLKTLKRNFGSIKDGKFIQQLSVLRRAVLCYIASECHSYLHGTKCEEKLVSFKFSRTLNLWGIDLAVTDSFSR
jgi:hypothetical protein